MRADRLANVLIAMGLAAGMAPVTVCAGDSLAECARVQDDLARLACYDRLAGRAPAVQAATPAVPAPALAAPAAAPAVQASAGAAQPQTATAPAASAPAADFGLSPRAIEERDPSKKVESITGTVTGVSQNASGRYVVELDNGQVWVQSESNSYPVLKTGDTVTIKRGAIGSFVLSGPRSVWWRVRRVR
jgi:hypothetical protein